MLRSTSSDASAPHNGLPATKLKVFISYSRDDLDFADQLLAGLRVCGFEPVLDRHDISGGEAWKRRLANLIRDADTVVFVLSLSSAASPICAWEVEEALRLGKRIIPIVCRSLDASAPHHALRDLNYIYFYATVSVPGSGFGAGLETLVTALNTDLDWLREHTRLLQRAQEWSTAGRSSNRMLSGSDIEAAKAWVAARPPSAPAPTELHLEYLRASEADQSVRDSTERQKLEAIALAQSERGTALKLAEEATRKRARLRVSAFVAMLLVASVAGWQWWQAVDANRRVVAERDQSEQQRRAAETARSEATQARDIAERERSRAVDLKTRQLLVAARQRTDAGDAVSAINLALEAVLDVAKDGAEPLVPPGVVAVLDGALRNLREKTVYRGSDGPVRSAIFSKDGTKVLTAGEDKTVRLFDSVSGKQLRVFGPHRGSAWLSAWLSDDGRYVGVLTNSNVATFWNAQTGVLAREFGSDAKLDLVRPIAGTNRVVVARPDYGISSVDLDSGETILLGTNGSVSDNGRTLQNFKTWETRASSVISPDGRHLIRQPACELVDTHSGRVISSLGHGRPCEEVNFSSHGAYVVVATAIDADRTATLFNVSTGERITSLPGGELGQHFRVSEDASVLSVMNIGLPPEAEQRVSFFRLGEPRTQLSSFRRAVDKKSSSFNPITNTLMFEDFSLSFNKDATVAAFTSHDRRRILWKTHSGELLSDLGHDGIGTFSNDGTIYASVRDGETLELHSATSGALVTRLAGHRHNINSIVFSADDKTVLTSSSDGTARLWSIEPRLLVRDIGAMSEVEAHRGGDDSMLRQAQGLQFNCGSKRLLFSHNSLRSTLFDLEAHRPIALINHGAQTTSGRFIDCDRFAVPTVTDGHDELRLLEASTGKLLGAYRSPIPRGERDAGVIASWADHGGWQFSSGLEYLLAHDHKGKMVHVWRTSDHTFVRSLDLRAFGEKATITLNPRAPLAAVRGDDLHIVVFDIPSGKPIREFPGEAPAFRWSRDGSRIARADGIWDVESGARVVELNIDKACGNLQSWSEEANLLAFSLQNQINVCVYDSRTGQVIWAVDHTSPQAHNDYVTYITFATENRLVTLSADNTARLWDARTGSLVAVLGVPDRPKDRHVRFRGDGPHAAFTDSDRLMVIGHPDAIRVWDIATGALQSEHKHSLGSLSSLTVSVDGSRIVAAGDSGGILLWDRVTRASELIDRAKREVPRCSDKQERVELGLDESEPDWCLGYRKWPYGFRRIGIDLVLNPGEPEYRKGKIAPPARGVRIEKIIRHLAGESAGLVVSDVIVAINGIAMSRAVDVNATIDGLPGGQPAVFEVLRGSAEMRITVIPSD